MKQKQSNPTMIDVATLAGVSRTTVSFVIKGNPGIPDETKERVMAAISELGYKPNLAAQSSRTQRSGFIGFLAMKSPSLRMLEKSLRALKMLPGIKARFYFWPAQRMTPSCRRSRSI